jgi:hypothetical protein
MDTEKTIRNREILDVIQSVSAKGESGRLEIMAGATSGAFYFSNGLLVDARVGNLTGFQAINAAASLRDAAASFDPSVTPPPFSSITQSERVVLKQFFGIDTVAPEEIHEPELLMVDEGEELHEPEHLIADDAEEFHERKHLIADEAEEVTLVRPSVPPAEVPTPLPYQSPATPAYRSGLAVAAVVFLFAMTAVALLYKYGDYSLPVVAGSVETPSAPVATQVNPEVKPIDNSASAAPGDRSAAPARVDDRTSAKPIDNRGSAASVDRIAATTASDDGPSSAPVDDGASAAQDLTGKWNVVNTIQKTSYGSYNNLQIGFNLSIEQSGKGFTGRGEKVSENGRSLPAGSRTPIQVKGSIIGDRVEATFYEQGSARKTNGRFVWRINKTGGLTGTFITNAAHSSGKSTARKV